MVRRTVPIPKNKLKNSRTKSKKYQIGAGIYTNFYLKKKKNYAEFNEDKLNGYYLISIDVDKNKRKYTKNDLETDPLFFDYIKLNSAYCLKPCVYNIESLFRYISTPGTTAVNPSTGIKLLQQQLNDIEEKYIDFISGKTLRLIEPPPIRKKKKPINMYDTIPYKTHDIRNLRKLPSSKRSNKPSVERQHSSPDQLPSLRDLMRLPPRQRHTSRSIQQPSVDFDSIRRPVRNTLRLRSNTGHSGGKKLLQRKRKMSIEIVHK